MLRAILTLTLIVGLASLAVAQSGPAQDSIYGTPSEARWAPFFADLPTCDDPNVLNRIVSRFDQTEQVYWGGAHAIAGFDRDHETGFRSNGLSYIPRRFCAARAELVDPRTGAPDPARTRTVVYQIQADAGMIGSGWGVEWCVVGLDRMRAYAPDCLVLRPIIERVIGEYRPLVRARD
jgi:hypothetical protein